MIRGFYTAVSGLMSSVRRMEVAINDLANVQTPGYRAERTAAASFSEQLVARLDSDNTPLPIGPLVLVNAAQPPRLDLRQGPISSTGRSLDIALDGPGFLVVETANGLAYTRDGSLMMDREGFLTNTQGARVLGIPGPIRLPPGEIAFGEDGSVYADGVAVGRLRLVEFDPEQAFERLGANLLVPADPDRPPGESVQTRVHQGALEGSNVDVTVTLTTMLELQRAYSANIRMIHLQDQLLARAATDIARPVA